MSKKFWVFIVSLSLLAVLAASAYFFGQGSFLVRDIVLEIDSPAQAASGEEIIFLVKYQNNTKVDLHQAEIILAVQQQKINKILPLIKAGEQGQFEEKLRLVGAPGEEQKVAALLRYTPENFNSVFEARAEKQILISSSIALLSLSLPSKAAPGELLDLTLTLVSKSESELAGAELFLSLPEGFNLEKVTPPFTNIDSRSWALTSLKKDEIKTFKIKGTVTGETGEIKEFSAYFSDIASTKAEVELSGTPLFLTIEKNGNLAPNERINFKINYENKSALELHNGVLTIWLGGPLFDFSSLAAEKAEINIPEQKLVWNFLTAPELALLQPESKGQFVFSVALKNFLATSLDDKNLKIKLSGEFQSQEKIDADFIEELKLNSRLTFKALGIFRETGVDIVNSGPLPPAVGEETMYTIHWRLANGFNDLDSFLVSAVLPANVSWTGNSRAENGRLFYNVSKNQVIWEATRVPAHIGALLPAYEAVFQIKFKPSSSQFGKVALLLNDSILEAQDSFTGEILNTSAPAISTSLSDDPTISPGQGIISKN